MKVLTDKQELNKLHFEENKLLEKKHQLEAWKKLQKPLHWSAQLLVIAANIFVVVSIIYGLLVH